MWGGAGGREGEEVKRKPTGEEVWRGRGTGEKGKRWETLEIMLLVILGMGCRMGAGGEAKANMAEFSYLSVLLGSITLICVLS